MQGSTPHLDDVIFNVGVSRNFHEGDNAAEISLVIDDDQARIGSVRQVSHIRRWQPLESWPARARGLFPNCQ